MQKIYVTKKMKNIFLILMLSFSTINKNNIPYSKQFKTISEIEEIIELHNNSAISSMILNDDNQQLSNNLDKEILYYESSILSVLEVSHFGNLGSIKQEVFYKECEIIKIKETIESYDKPYTFNDFKVVATDVKEYYYFTNGDSKFVKNGVLEVLFISDYVFNSDRVNTFRNFISSKNLLSGCSN